MNNHVVKVVSADFVTYNVKRFIVEKPPGFTFIPGQATEISINKPGLENEARPFTFTSLSDSPYLEFIIKIYQGHNGMTEKLLLVKAGDELILHDVFGTIAYKGPGLFLAGGAGITPFISIFRHLKTQNKLDGNTLLFGNRASRDIILQEELKALLGEHYIDVLEIATDPGIPGRFIDSDLIRQYSNEKTAYYYICGPDKFTSIMYKKLIDLGVTAEQIIIEE